MGTVAAKGAAAAICAGGGASGARPGVNATPAAHITVLLHEAVDALLHAEFEQPPPVIVLTETLSQQEAGALLRHQAAFVCPLSDPTNVGLRSALLSVLRIQQLRALLSAADAQNRQQREDLQGMHKLDPLTGLMNSQSFYENLEVEFRRSARSAQPLSLVVAEPSWV